MYFLGSTKLFMIVEPRSFDHTRAEAQPKVRMTCLNCFMAAHSPNPRSYHSVFLCFLEVVNMAYLGKCDMSNFIVFLV